MVRKTLSVEVRKRVLHEAGYKCANPVCRHVLTIDIHHLVPVSDKGPDQPENLVALCPNCHSLHHNRKIPVDSIRAWKFLLLSLNEGFDRRAVDLLLALDKVGPVYVSGEGLLECSALIASGLVERFVKNVGEILPKYSVNL